MQHPDFAEALRIAVHEASHAWACQRLGVQFRAWVDASLRNGGVALLSPVDRYAGRLIGLAGAAGELLRAHPDLTAADLVRISASLATPVSAEDRRLTGPIDNALAEETLVLVRENTGGIHEYALQLIAEAQGHKPAQRDEAGRLKGVVYL